MIGSGPAGCAAAATCHRAGLRVLIVTQAGDVKEQTSLEAQPVESIHPGVASLLEKIGASGVEQSATVGKYSGIYASDAFTPLGEDEIGVWYGLHINRAVFDLELLRDVADQGVTIRLNSTVDDFIMDRDRVIGIKTGNEELYAKYIIDASGKKSIAGKKLNFTHKFYSPPLLCWTGVSGDLDSYSFDPHAAHFIAGDQQWTWLAPLLPGRCAWTRLRMKGEKSLLPPEELKNDPVIGEVKFANMRWRMYAPVCKEGIVLCGDAAGILDPAAGQGIFNALWSGITAAEAVVSCIRQPDLEAIHLAVYNDWFVQQFEMKVNQLRTYYAEQGLLIVEYK